jgi:hypothetical protein
MKLILSALLLSLVTSAFAGGLLDRKTGNEIKLECLDDNCQTLSFVETNSESGLKSVLGKSISKEELLLAADRLAEDSLDNEKVGYLLGAKDSFNNFKRQIQENPASAVVVVPIGVALLAIHVVIEGTFDLGFNGAVGASNIIKTQKLNKFFRDQLNGDGEKVIKLRHKKYLQFKSAINKA